jgi:fimbrial chaperone protein
MPCRLRLIFLAAVFQVCGMAAASGLQVSPVTLTLLPAQKSDSLWFSNSGDILVNAQVRVYKWTQEGGKDKLTPSRGLLVSPPMLQLPVEGAQLVRVLRTGAPPSGQGAAEESYRVIIDELPSSTDLKTTLQFVVRYSVPVFIAPSGVPSSGPQLQWALRQEAGQPVLEVANSGNSHAQLADLNFTDSTGHSTVVHAGLLGYVLPGAQMNWALASPAATFTTGGTWKIMINGSDSQQIIQSVDSPS